MNSNEVYKVQVWNGREFLTVNEFDTYADAKTFLYGNTCGLRTNRILKPGEAE